MTSRKVPVPRSSPGKGGGRPVSRPSGASSAAAFESPFQPPASDVDMRSDISMLDPDAWHFVHVGAHFWRVKTPTANSIGLLAEILERKGGHQISAINMFLAAHMHPDDLNTLLDRMSDPDDSFSGGDYQQLYRDVVTAGTARPFRPSSVSYAPLPTAGERSGGN